MMEPPSIRWGLSPPTASGKPSCIEGPTAPLKRAMASRTRTLTLIDDGRPMAVDAAMEGDAIAVSPDELGRTLGWELKAQGLCRGDACFPVRDRAALVRADGIDLRAFAQVLDLPFAADVEAGVAVLGASARDRANQLASME